jgi:hypothetical protein
MSNQFRYRTDEEHITQVVKFMKRDRAAGRRGSEMEHVAGGKGQ